MEVSLYQAAAAMNATEQWQELISENLAGASTPGARKHEISFSAVQAGLTPPSADPTRPGFVIPMATATTNFQQGELHSTGDPMDAALEGSGLFTLQSADGATTYTRNGEFQVNSQSQLVTTRGDLVMGDNGPIQLSPGNPSPITISPSGEVTQGTAPKGKLQITEFNNPGLLTALGGGIFRADDASLQSNPSANTQVRQGFVENANSVPTLEMSGLITAMRMFESNQKVLQMQSDRMSREITDLGAPS